MKILLSVEHPAWVHQFKYIIKELTEKGHEVKVLAIRKDVTIDLLNAYSIPYEIISESSGNNTFEKGLIFLSTTWKIYNISKKYHPNMYIGRSSPMMAINSYIFKKPHILFEDTEAAKFSLFICKYCSDIIITSTSFKLDLGKKQKRIPAYKELFYLHPSRFTPNPVVLSELGLTEIDRYFILRFVSFDAHHDIGQSGIKDKLKLVERLIKYGRVLITSEGSLPEELEKYRIRISPEKIHDLMAYATLCVGESPTMATEAACLGVHAVLISTIYHGYNEELERKYGLITIINPNMLSEISALNKIESLIQDPLLREKNKAQLQKVLLDSCSPSEEMLNIINSTLHIQTESEKK